MTIFDFVSKYAWAVFIIVTMMNAAIFRFRSRKHIEADPKLAEGYDSLIRGFIFWANIPWVVMGVGCTIGGVPTIWHYFRPQDGDPYVLAWFASVFFVWLMGSYWLLFKGGAEKMAKHPGLLRASIVGDVSNPIAIKILWVLCLIGGIVGVVMMWTQDVLLP